MMPEEPSRFAAPGAGDLPWHWALLDSAGAPVEVSAEYADQRFASQGDAESWVGEIWAELAEQGVDAVTLHEVDRVVYGPMSLHA
ncbi:hypothetical protein [Nocardioides houyundeii]|uniref:hypothetical protein n=2 Tax=Nocardioides houyundeii TaxID=2045452 RepID=UPI001F53029B|nr:hypothetical protein [Nocardioides houyundeii]